jgi:hypothetical protein
LVSLSNFARVLNRCLGREKEFKLQSLFLSLLFSPSLPVFLSFITEVSSFSNLVRFPFVARVILIDAFCVFFLPY